MIKEKLSTTMLDEVLRGLSDSQKNLPSKYFYDERGSELFDEITELEEYYPTRTERKILKDNVASIQQYLGDEIILIEPGSGSSEKTRILLNRLDGIKAYVPIDISGEYLFKVGDTLKKEFPGIKIRPLATDYTTPFELPDELPSGRPIVFFPGSTIGNFSRQKVERFLKVIHDLLDGEGGFLIGADLRKDVSILKAAYNDSKGITAAFNKNILLHINRLLGADFDPSNYRHEAIWNEEHGRIEMHLISLKDHIVNVQDKEFRIGKGEVIHTENSHKYSLDEFSEMVSPWFEVEKVWTDEDKLFSIQYLRPLD